MGVALGGASLGTAAPAECPAFFKPTGEGCAFDDPALAFTIPPNGLLRPWPALSPEQVNNLNAKRVALGRLLFFDPVLSGDNKSSCGHCHDPKTGMGDGQRLGRGLGAKGTGKNRKGGKTLRRNTPTIYNTAFEEKYFWDARAVSLEHQAMFPISHPDEMNQPLDKLEGELEAVAAYRELFAEAFPGTEKPVNLNHVFVALSAFERSIVSVNSRYDRYVNGDETALTAAEVRGLTVFRSLNTRCFECHLPPSFNGVGVVAVGTPRVKGDAEDLGAMEQNPTEGLREAFKTPTLRNIAVTGPYMHNGAFKTLEEVVDFYAKGGGFGAGNPLDNIDRQIMKFDLHGTEKADLVAFLKALTDESAKPVIPKTVPSGLPVMR